MSAHVQPRHMPPPTWAPRGPRGLRISPRHALIPVSLVFLMILAFGFQVPFGWLVAAALIAPIALVVSSVWVTKRLPRFEMRFNQLMQRGDTRAMQQHLRQARLLRWMAPSDRMLAKRGMIHMLEGDARSAEEYLEDAYDMAPKNRRAELLGPLARVKYDLERYDELLEIAEQWRARALFTGSANVYLAAAHLRGYDKDVEKARELLDEVDGSLGKSDAELADRLRAELSTDSGAAAQATK